MFWVFGAEPAAAIIIIITVGHESRDALLSKITQHEGWNDAVQVQTTQTDPLNKLRRRQNVLSPHVYFILLKKLHLNAPQRLQVTDVLQEKKLFCLFWGKQGEASVGEISDSDSFPLTLVLILHAEPTHKPPTGPSSVGPLTTDSEWLKALAC